ncbi:hypothetical protein B0H19DRAFT_1241929 [Mycena capillaripes]|nr:hypothetical protein B0H19DRAFT_1241929 [Mycena capillaripes]
MTSRPALPPELEREVFEICALSRPVSIPKLMLVAPRVKEWVEPLLYRIVALGSYMPFRGFPEYREDVISRAIMAKPPGFFDTAVRHLMIWSSLTQDTDKILVAFTRLQNLLIFDLHDSWLALVAALPLQRLYTDCDSFVRVVSAKHILHWRLTHLDISISVLNCDTVYAALISLPHLTHLSFWQPELVPFCPRMLKSCIFLRALVCCDPQATTEIEEHRAVLAPDVRFVLFSMSFASAHILSADWHTGAKGGTDYWTRVELFIAKRRAQEIDPLQYEIDLSLVHPLR